MSGEAEVGSANFQFGVWALLFVRTVEQVRRAFRIVAGFTLLLAGAVMVVTPGPGWLVILLGLGLLAAEFVWARRLMDRIKREGDRIKETVLGKAPVSRPEDRAPVSLEEPTASE